MPEMPEVETARRLIADLALGRRIVGVDDADTFVCRPHSPGELRAALTGRVLTAAHRRGKTMWCETSGADGSPGPDLGIHLGMSGRIMVTSADGWVAEGGDPPDREAQPRKAAWDRFTLEFADGGRMALFDKRRLGRILLNPDIGALGPDAADVTPAQFRALITKGTIAVKARLLDQSKIAGIGNLLADEILWQARISPATPVSHLQRKDVDRLYRALRSVLAAALATGGGAHTGGVIAARRPGGSCPRCGAEMAHGTVGGRSTWWCSREQAGRSLGFAGQVAHDLDFGPQRQAIAQLTLGQLDGRAMELGLADVLDGLIGRTGSGQPARVQLRVRELQGERNL
jgi:formamidopyrimidine-DNA glycosylase